MRDHAAARPHTLVGEGAAALSLALGQGKERDERGQAKKGAGRMPWH